MQDDALHDQQSVIQHRAIESAMRRALELALRGPKQDENPQVGCVILSPDQRIIAEGWHLGVGTPHAETDALTHIPKEWKGRAHELTAVVTLEPCNHTGHTGPCAKALIDAGIGHVAYAILDPGDASGGGAAQLRDAGVKVTPKVLETEARMMLSTWLAQQLQQQLRLQSTPEPAETINDGERPRIIVKWAETLDGRAAADDGSSQWITGAEARQHVHAERALADAILVGTGTLFADNPSLTARNPEGGLLVDAILQPIPVIVGRRAIPAGSTVLEHPALTAHNLNTPITIEGKDLVSDLRQLRRRGIRSVYVEGGPTVISSLLQAELVDELHIYIAPKLLGGQRVAIGDLGISSIDQTLHLEVQSITRLGPDLLIVATPDFSLCNTESEG